MFNDNPKPNRIDRVFVSETQSWEMSHFVDHYLKTRGYAINAQSRETIRNWVSSYPGRAPIQRDQLQTWLDAELTKASRR